MACQRVHVEEAPGNRVVVSGAQIIKAQIRVVLFAAVEIVVRRCSRRVDLVAKGVVLITVGNRARGVSQLAKAAAAVNAVEARRPRAADKLVLADPVKAIRVLPCYRAAD